MSDHATRLSQLSPEQRAAVTRAARDKLGAGTRTAAATASVTDDLVLETSSSGEPAALKASYKRFYDTVTTQLNSSPFGQFSFFLNYGYLPDGSPELASVALPEQYINRNSVKLVLELIGDVNPNGKRVLDVGCGRGGTLYTFKTFFKPASLTGLDLSSEAIAFCRKAHGDAKTTFQEGDAERLPFPDGGFDIVTNVESSHSYPNIHLFYSAVHRVLAPGGYFLYTDALSRQQIETSLAFFHHIGMDVQSNRDITKNVLLSCDAIAKTRVAAFDSRNDPELMQNFLATPGSHVYEEMKSGRWEYRIFKLHKRRV